MVHNKIDKQNLIKKMYIRRFMLSPGRPAGHDVFGRLRTMNKNAESRSDFIGGTHF